MNRTIVAVGIIVAVLVSAGAAYACGRHGPALSTTHWLTSATEITRYPQNSWLTIRVNSRDTDLGKEAVVLDGEAMLPVTAMAEFGLTPTRSGLNHRMLTLSGGRYLIELTVGSREAEVGHARRILPVAPKWHDGKVYIPIDSIGRLLDGETSFNKLSGVISVRTKGADLVSHKNAAGSARARAMYEEAIGEYAKAIQLDPNDWSLYQRLGDATAGRATFNDALAASHAAIGATLKRVRDYKLLAEQGPPNDLDGFSGAVTLAAAQVSAYRSLGARYHGTTDVREPDQALDIYEQTVLIGPDFARTIKSACPTQVLASDLEEAISEARTSSAAAKQRAQQGYQDALASLREAMKRVPASHLEFKRLAENYHANNQFKEAVAAYQKALTLDPEHPEAKLELAQALIAQGGYEQGVAEAQAAIDMDPTSAAAHNILGYALRKQGRKDEAIAAYRQAIELDDEFALAYNNLGVALLDMEQPGNAAAMLAEAVGLAPSRADFWGNYALALFGVDDVDGAIRGWSAAVALSPGVPEYHASLGMAMGLRGNVAAAIAESRAAIDGSGAAARAAEQIQDEASRQEAQGDVAQAILTARRTIAWGQLERGRTVEALAEAREALKLDGTGAPTQAALAAILIEMMQAADAVEPADKAVAEDPDNGEYQAIAAAAKALSGRVKAGGEHLDKAMYVMGSGGTRWAWYFTGRAAAALGRTPEAVCAFLQPQPDRYCEARRAHIADYLARHTDEAIASMEAQGAATDESEAVEEPAPAAAAG